jgi:hypothetical protein
MIRSLVRVRDGERFSGFRCNDALAIHVAIAVRKIVAFALSPRQHSDSSPFATRFEELKPSAERRRACGTSGANITSAETRSHIGKFRDCFRKWDRTSLERNAHRRKSFSPLAHVIFSMWIISHVNNALRLLFQSKSLYSLSVRSIRGQEYRANTHDILQTRCWNWNFVHTMITLITDERYARTHEWSFA